MYYPALAERVRYLKKDEQGIREMYGEIERLQHLGEQRGVEKGRIEGRIEGRREEQQSSVARMLALGKFSLEDIAKVFDIALDDVKAIANRQAGGAK